MDFFPGIRAWLKVIGELSLLYKLRLRNPGDITAVIETIRTNELALLKYETGHAITQWAIMEERLILIATLLLKTAPEKTGLVFYSIINFQVWISIITELFDLEPEFSNFQNRWNKLYERLRREKDSRDRLAHHYTMSAAVSDNPLGKAVSKPSRIDMRAKSRKSDPMTYEQADAFSSRIGTIADDLLKLFEEMKASRKLELLPSQDKSSEQGSDPSS